jgi:hypothetical protein
MFSIDNFYNILYSTVLKPCNLSFEIYNHNELNYNRGGAEQWHGSVIFHDQEPLLASDIERFNNYISFKDLGVMQTGIGTTIKYPDYFRTIVANSEVSEYKDQLLQHYCYHDWYFFSHGFLALDWFRDIQYLLDDRSSCFDKVFIMYNNLVAKDRSYRLGIVADILSRGIRDQGLISLPLKDAYHGPILNEVFDKASNLSMHHKKMVLQTICKLDTPLTIDSNSVNGTYSAKINLADCQRAFWHVVPETNFYHKKLHLTEKIFKPIVSYRPFILASYAGNLKYLRSYGFKTFGDFIDESYDEETDNTKRMTMIVDEVEKLCKLSIVEQQEMFAAMTPVLEHNFNHFYGRFKKIIVDEMIYGFAECIDGLVYDAGLDYAAVAAKLAK